MRLTEPTIALIVAAIVAALVIVHVVAGGHAAYDDAVTETK